MTRVFCVREPVSYSPKILRY